MRLLMKEQEYKNHTRYYPAHHFVFYPLVLLLLGISIRSIINDPGNRWEWIIITALAVMIGWLSFMVRQHYALTCQNRIVRLEFSLRYYQLTGHRLEEIEAQLTFGQIAALRFASDAELPELITRTLADNLEPDAIKRSIKSWQPDHMRV